MPKKMNLLLPALMLAVLPQACHAGLTAGEKALWGASTEAPTTFALPAGQDVSVMTKAQSLLSSWATLDRYMYAMPILKQSATLIQTEDPTVLNEVGFKVLDTRTANGSVITVDVSAFEGKVLQVSQQRRDANKRAHLLAYLLEQYAGVGTSPAPLPVPAPVAVPQTVPPQPASPQTVPTPMVSAPSPNTAYDLDVQRLRSQLDSGQYDAALSTLDTLRAAIAARH